VDELVGNVDGLVGEVLDGLVRKGDGTLYAPAEAKVLKRVRLEDRGCRTKNECEV